jgi:hypothetical protein
VTPQGIRDADPLVLALLVERRGGRVLAYGDEVAAPDHALQAAAEAFTAFRLAVGGADDTGQIDPEATLLHATRHAAARHAENPYRPFGRELTEHRTSACELMPRLLVAWIESRLSVGDEQRLVRHLRRCPDCRALQDAFARAEERYRTATAATPDATEASVIVSTMAAAPLVAAVAEPEGADEAAPEPVEPPAPVEAPAADEAMADAEGHEPEAADATPPREEAPAAIEDAPEGLDVPEPHPDVAPDPEPDVAPPADPPAGTAAPVAEAAPEPEAPTDVVASGLGADEAAPAATEPGPTVEEPVDPAAHPPVADVDAQEHGSGSPSPLEPGTAPAGEPTDPEPEDAEPTPYGGVERSDDDLGPEESFTEQPPETPVDDEVVAHAGRWDDGWTHEFEAVDGDRPAEDDGGPGVPIASPADPLGPEAIGYVVPAPGFPQPDPVPPAPRRRTPARSRRGGGRGPSGRPLVPSRGDAEPEAPPVRRRRRPAEVDAARAEAGEVAPQPAPPREEPPASEPEPVPPARREDPIPPEPRDDAPTTAWRVQPDEEPFSDPVPDEEHHAWAQDDAASAWDERQPSPPVSPATVEGGGAITARPAGTVAVVVRQLGVPAILLVLVVVAALLVAGVFGDDGDGQPPATTTPTTVPSDPSQLPSLDLP